jgi:hypothetical protein
LSESPVLDSKLSWKNVYAYINSYNYLFLKYSKIVFFIQKKNTRTIRNLNVQERSGTFDERSARKVMNDRYCIFFEKIKFKMI